MVLVGELDVVGDVQVQVAVAVDVQKAGPGADLLAVADAGRGGHVGERAVAVVAVQHVRAEVAHVEVRVAVVVVVADGDAQPVAGVRHARRSADVRELANRPVLR